MSIYDDSTHDPFEEVPEHMPDGEVVAFVYGTLRVSDRGTRWGGWARGYDSSRTVEKATIDGDLYFVSSRGSYPVADLDGDGTIIGDVLVFPHTTAGGHGWADICNVEIGAGYEAREVDVTLPDGSVIKAQAWHYMHPPRGDQILNGDWCNPIVAKKNNTRR